MCFLALILVTLHHCFPQAQPLTWASKAYKACLLLEAHIHRSPAHGSHQVSAIRPAQRPLLTHTYGDQPIPRPSARANTGSVAAAATLQVCCLKSVIPRPCPAPAPPSLIAIGSPPPLGLRRRCRARGRAAVGVRGDFAWKNGDVVAYGNAAGTKVLVESIPFGGDRDHVTHAEHGRISHLRRHVHVTVRACKFQLGRPGVG